MLKVKDVYVLAAALIGDRENDDRDERDFTIPYMKGDKVRHVEKVWESAIDNNVWEPGVYGWSEV